VPGVFLCLDSLTWLPCLFCISLFYFCHL
jgi:hypothetical protein